MVKLALLAIAGATMTLGSAGQLNLKAPVKEKRDAQIIIELESSTFNRTRSSIIKEQNSLLSNISNLVTSNFNVLTHITNISNVVAIEVPSKYVSQIRKLANVKDINYNRVRAVQYFDGAETKILKKRAAHVPETDNASKETMHVPAESNEGEGTLIAVLDSAFRLEHETFQPLAEGVTQKVTQADVASKKEELHAVVDNEHSCYYNSKIPFIYDYGGQKVGVKNEVITPDWDVNPTQKDNDHGTHCASIAASNGQNKGVAPKAQLALLKVFTETTPTAEEKEEGYSESIGAQELPMLQALEDSVVIGADVISISIGSTIIDDFDSDSIFQNAIRTAEEKGVFVNIAAGNSGKGSYHKSAAEYWPTSQVETGFVSSYATNDASMTVAAAQPTWIFFEQALLVNGTNVSYQDEVTNYNSTDGAVEYDPERHLSDLVTESSNELSWVRVGGWGETKDYSDLTLTGKVAIVDRGETTFVSKIQAAEAAGAAGIIIINNVVSETDFTSRFALSGYNPKIPAAQCLYRDRELFGSAGDTGTMNLLLNSVADNPTAYQVTSFTSDGPAYNLDIKPEISAPGQSIRGAIAEDANKDGSYNDYEYFNGTSMATPNFAGAEALVISEHLGDANYRSSIPARMMSTANIMLDDQRVNHSSVRIQGAGMVDVGRALNTKVYLEGVQGANNEGTGKAKICLYNNDDIAGGNIKLSFKAHNESENAITYTATTYVYNPALGQYSDQLYPDFTGNFQSIKDELLVKKTQSITVNPGAQVVTLDTISLTKDQKSKLQKNFENGNYLEGYVVLTAESGTDNNVNIPFLGFFGDYSKEIPIEPFSFEKVEGKTYGSDMVDKIASVIGCEDPHFGSEWVEGYWADMEDVDLEGIILNSGSILSMKDGNKNTVIKAGTDPYTGELNPNTFYFGNNGATNTMIIQQFVNRSVKTNDITLTNKATGEVVLRDHMFDSLIGSSEEGEEFYGLCKSHCNDDLLGSHIVASRAYTIIPCYDTKTKELFPDGEYTMEFKYVLQATGTVYKLFYNIVIDSASPLVKSVEEKGSNIRIRYGETNVSYVTINGSRKELKHDSNGYYVDVPKSDYSVSKPTIFLKTYNKAYGTSASITSAYDTTYHVTVANDNLIMTNLLTCEVTESKGDEGVINRDFAVVVKAKNGKPITLEGNTYITVKLDGLNPDELRVLINDNEVEFTTENGYVTFEVTDPSNLTFRLSSTKGGSSGGGSSSKGGCGGNVVASSFLLTSITISLLAFALLRRKKFKR